MKINIPKAIHPQVIQIAACGQRATSKKQNAHPAVGKSQQVRAIPYLARVRRQRVIKGMSVIAANGSEQLCLVVRGAIVDVEDIVSAFSVDLVEVQTNSGVCGA